MKDSVSSDIQIKESWGVWIADETLSLVFEISSQSKKKKKLRGKRKS